jgi:phytoene synthase
LRKSLGARRELDAAGIRYPRLRADYEHCRRLAAGHGRTYFLATRLLPAADRPAVHALYGFARTADEIVDETTPGRTVEERRVELAALGAQLRMGHLMSDPTCRAVVDTAERYRIAPKLFDDFLDSMQMDLTVTEYETYADLEVYMHGSAAVIGLQMLPVLGAVGPTEDAAPYAAKLGIAFQLTNFIRDIGEDLRRGRIYLPQTSLREFGVDRAHLEAGVADEPVRRLLRFEIERTRTLYREAEAGIELLDPRSRPCVRTAFTLYRQILTEVERADYQVLGRRVGVANRRRIPVAAVGLVRAVSARRRLGDRATPRPIASR